MVSSHGNIQGYNGQALVDSKHQVIVHGEVFGEAQEHHFIPPMLDGAKNNMAAIGQSEDYFAGKTFTADSNYHDPTNLKRCDEEKVDAYIPDKRFRNRDPRFQGERRRTRRRVDRFRLAEFKYNEGTDEYVCPNGKALKAKTFMDKETTRIGDFIHFDVEVEVTEGKAESGGAKISILSVGGFGGKLCMPSDPMRQIEGF